MSCSDINSLPNLAALLGVSVDELMQFKKRTPTSKENLKEIIDMIFKAVALAKMCIRDSLCTWNSFRFDIV